MTRESVTAWGLGTIGAAQGAMNYYVKPAITETRPSTKALVTIIGGGLIYDAFCAKGETVSEAVHRAKEKRPITTSVIIGTTALHLLNVLPKPIDPFYQTLKFIKH
jgi:hypothetical protein